MPLQHRVQWGLRLQSVTALWFLGLLVLALWQAQGRALEDLWRQASAPPVVTLDDLTLHDALARPERYQCTVRFTEDALGPLGERTATPVEWTTGMHALTAVAHGDEVQAALQTLAPHAYVVREQMRVAARQSLGTLPESERILVPFTWELDLARLPHDGDPNPAHYRLAGNSKAPSTLTPALAQFGALYDSLRAEAGDPPAAPPGLFKRLRVAAAENEGHWVRLALQRPAARGGVLSGHDEWVELRTQTNFRASHGGYYLSFQPHPNRQMQQTNLHEVLGDYLAPFLADEAAFESHAAGRGHALHGLPREPAVPSIVVRIEHWWLDGEQAQHEEATFVVHATRDPGLYPAVAALFTQMETDTRADPL